MLKIHYGIREDTIVLIDIDFDHSFEPEWFNDELVKDMVLDIDKSEVIGPYCINSPVFGQISPYMLSGGVKALIMMYKTDYVINASNCGDNCAKWIKQIAKSKDLEIDLEHIMYFNDDNDNNFHAYFINDNTLINSYAEYLIKMAEYQG